MSVTVIIPTLDEEQWIERSIASSFAAGAAEVIVADGGSGDRTVSLAETSGARVILESGRGRDARSPMRARQMNAGASLAAGDFLIFLHADTLLPEGAAAAVERSGASFGGFRIAFAEPLMKLRLAAALINLRTAMTRCPWGDQAQFVKRKHFPGFREIAIMEDYDLAMRMRKEARILPLYVVTSGRRFLRKGVLRTAFTNRRLIASYHRGVHPDELARVYRR